MVVCRYFQRGTCKFGNNCRFEHSTTAGRQNYGGNYYNNQYSFPTGNQFSDLVDNKSDDRNSKSAVPNQALTLNDFIVSVCLEVEAGDIGKQWPLSCFGPRKEGDNYPGLEDASPEELRHEAYQCQANGTMNTYIWNVERLCKVHQEICQNIKKRSPEAIATITNLHNQTKPVSIQSTRNEPLFSQPLSTTISASSFQFRLPNNDQPPQTNTTFFGQHAPVTWPAAQQSFGNVVPSIFGNSNANTIANSTFAASHAQQNETQQSFFGGGTSFTNQSGILSTPDANVSANFQPTSPLSPDKSYFNNSNSSAPVVGNSFGQNNSSAFGSAPPITSFATVPSSQSILPAKVQRDTDGLYSEMEEIANEELEQFQAPQFSLAKVPLRPPPIELCF